MIDQGGGFRDSLCDIGEELCPPDSDSQIALPYFVRAPNQVSALPLSSYGDPRVLILDGGRTQSRYLRDQSRLHRFRRIRMDWKTPRSLLTDQRAFDPAVDQVHVEADYWAVLVLDRGLYDRGSASGKPLLLTLKY